MLEVIPLQDSAVPDFAKAYPDLDRCARALRQRLRAGALPDATLPVYNCLDAEPTIFAKPRRVETPWCLGLWFITRYTQESGAPVDNRNLSLTFQGLSRDDRHFVWAEIPLTQTGLPESGEGRENLSVDEVNAYYRRVEHQLTQAPDASFTPSLEVVDSLLQSLQPVELPSQP
nr:hypothetical protein [uncultured Holophaga sp.]